MNCIVRGQSHNSVIQGLEEDQVLDSLPRYKLPQVDAEKEDYPEGKGKINNEISCLITAALEKAGI